MGSFSLRCAISGLPITPRDPVIVLFLQQRVMVQSNCEYSEDRVWAIRSFPFEARYNDYGSIDKWTESEITRTFEKYINIDGFVGDYVGDRMEVKKHKKPFTLNVVANLSAEEHMFVYKNQSQGRKRKKGLEETTPDVNEVIKLVGDKVNQWSCTQHHGWCCLNSMGQVPHDEVTQIVATLNTKYAALETMTSSASEFEIRVFNPPTKDPNGLSVIDVDFNAVSEAFPYRPIRLCLILKDVWEYALSTEHRIGIMKYSLDDIKKALQKRRGKKRMAKALQKAEDPAWVEYAFDLSDERDFAVFKLDSGEGRVPNDWVRQYQDLEREDQLTDEIINRTAELIHVLDYMLSVRVMLGPSNSLGDQCGDLDPHIDLAKFVLEWAEKRKEEQEW